MIYADNAATTKMSKTAIDAMLPYMEEYYGNPSSLYAFAQKAKEALEDARTGYVSDGWALVLSVCGALLMISREAFLPCLLTGAGMGALYGLLYLISKKSLGLADVFLAAASSLWLLPVYGLLSLWLTSLAALLWCAFLLLRGRLGRRTEIRFVPFLAIGGALAYGVQETVGMASLLASLGLSSL